MGRSNRSNPTTRRKSKLHSGQSSGASFPVPILHFLYRRVAGARVRTGTHLSRSFGWGLATASRRGPDSYPSEASANSTLA